MLPLSTATLRHVVHEARTVEVKIFPYMNLLRKVSTHSSFLTIWLRNNKNTLRCMSTYKSIEQCLNEMKKRGDDVNVLSLVISNNNLCYCLLKKKMIKKIGLINIKKDFYPYNQSPVSTKRGKTTFEKDHLRYNYDKEENPLSFNIREILSVLNFIKLYSNREEKSSTLQAKDNSGENTNPEEHEKSRYNDIEHERVEVQKLMEEHERVAGSKHTKRMSLQQSDHFEGIRVKEKEEWIIGIEKVNEKYEKNKIKEKILSVIVYFLQSIFHCKIIFFCPKEARKYFSNKCNHHFNSREETYNYIKKKIQDFPSVEKNVNNLNCLFSDCYLISLYTYRFYMHEVVKNNRKIFKYLEKEVRRNRSFNNILQTLKKTEDEKCKLDLSHLLRDRISRVVENEAYRLVDRLLMEVAYGSRLWKPRMEATYGSHVWKPRMEATYGSHVWKPRLEATSGSHL
ncbi:hypothetical protein POVCU2_0034770 [Plasmodium ovale curtisi]|uniref:Uncharacterized protein n=1 Tax=Plasmodium ovale curtisi TaxID=864141 RepID=A0A1A8W2Y5_PLAOA|nr:hypothetical protein POVCU2_0034770 [Plasmodium ovale curtisi]